MAQPDFIHYPPRPASLLKGLSIVASITAISIAAALCYERYRNRELVRSLAATPGAADILPYLDLNSRQLLASLGKIVPPKS